MPSTDAITKSKKANRKTRKWAVFVSPWWENDPPPSYTKLLSSYRILASIKAKYTAIMIQEQSESRLIDVIHPTVWPRHSVPFVLRMDIEKRNACHGQWGWLESALKVRKAGSMLSGKPVGKFRERQRGTWARGKYALTKWLRIKTRIENMKGFKSSVTQNILDEMYETSKYTYTHTRTMFRVLASFYGA